MSPPEIDELEVRAYTIPTDFPESDGTFEWRSTTIVIVTVRAKKYEGIGYTYADRSAAALVRDQFADLVIGTSSLAVSKNWNAMIDTVRNLGRPGIASMAIAAVDNALWDLKAKVLDLAVVDLLGMIRPAILAYGSGGFTSYSTEQLQKQLGGWIRQGLKAVKMKVGRNPDEDPHRVQKARDAIGPAALLLIDANGAYSIEQALRLAQDFQQYDVRWFEEPVSSDDLHGLREIRMKAPPGMDIAAGEYGYDSTYFCRMLNARAVDVLQADATRCGGITGFLKAAALCEAFHVPLSAHTAPTIHTHVCCAVRPAVHVEYFHDHVRIEHLFFDGALTPVEGNLYPERSRPGFGLTFLPRNAEPYAVEF